ncbi:hypothetical protein [Paenibacillus soyae]|uniref:Uncharacterized protein n=1 Tax=Paenibacillus soyae TaxID=2969249 RepID=A0A9X2MRL9_9BACL|nr:hypothetical protein [Paenibacillus soyae]MCR2802677.1 hypothetical protein [Paenibacillus soyae]
MYFSVIRNNRFFVIVADGVVETELIELPTEELSDQVAYLLQLAWNEGELWGKETQRKEMDPLGYSKVISEAILRMKSLTHDEINAESEFNEKRIDEYNRQVMVQVLSWKSTENQ